MDSIQDYCERTYTKAFYFSDEINSDISLMVDKMIECNISKAAAEAIYRRVNKEYHEADVNMVLEDSDIYICLIKTYKISLIDMKGCWKILMNGIKGRLLE